MAGIIRKLDHPFAEGGGSFDGRSWLPPAAAVDMGLISSWGEDDQHAIIAWAKRNHKSSSGLFIISSFRVLVASPETIKGLQKAEAQGCVGAAYMLGVAFEHIGRLADASTAYARAAAGGHIGGLIGLCSLATDDGAGSLRAIRCTLVDVMSRPDALEVAQRLGCVSLIADAVWDSANFLRFGGRTPGQIFDHRATGGRPKAVTDADAILSATIERLLVLGERVGDDLCALARIEERVGLTEHTLQDHGLPSKPKFCTAHAVEAIGLCSAQWGRSKVSIFRSRAATLAADLAESAGFSVAEKFAWYRRAADEESATSSSVFEMYMALESGVGLTRDIYAARRYLAMGVALSVGPCMERVAAERSGNGDTFGAADLWRRAAALDNVRAISVWEGISIREASKRIFGPSRLWEDSEDVFHCSLGGEGGIVCLTVEEASALGIRVDHRYRCASCDIMGRLGDHVEGKVRWLNSIAVVAPPKAPLLVACSACRVALYCSKACQRVAWKSGHKEQCAGIGAAATLRRREAELSLAGGLLS